MILVTVGTQLPFDRLVRAMDALVPMLGMPAFAQIGSGSYRPRNMEWEAEIAPAAFDTMLARTTVIVSHAGTGTYLMAQKLRKPIVLMPRRAACNEHRNDHQLATAAQLDGRPGVIVAMDEADLERGIRAAAAAPVIEAEPPAARLAFLRAIEAYISEG